MTTEQAIKLLHRLQDEQFDGQHGDERREALEMAIRALSGDGDLIYRQDAIDACCFGITHARVINVETGVAVDLFTESNKELHKAIERIEALPSAQPHWIPCSERLPEANGRYLVTRGLNACGSLWNRIYIANYSDLMGIKSEKIWWKGNVGKSDFERLDDVLAWMPLPKPYGGESE